MLPFPAYAVKWQQQFIYLINLNKTPDASRGLIVILRKVRYFQ